jgi:CRISPR system Cascade subunit CasC
MFIELHMLQNFAPANLNRDDTNNPKDCEFGGVRRARISSQCIKRAIREEPVFAQTTTVDNSTRTRYLARFLTGKLVKAGKPEEEASRASKAFAESFVGKLDKSGRTDVLIFMSAEEKQMVADVLLENWDAIQKEEYDIGTISKDLEKATRKRTSAPDIALFGRMLANNPKLNLDAACQVAHAISTHRVSMEMDFFTAVDDLQKEEETGAGMMGIIPFNSACFYSYARIDWKQLLDNLDSDFELARKTVEGFLRAAAQAVPSGKQNSFAAQNPPSLMLAAVRDDGRSWSLANAFEKPVRPDRDGGLVSPSIEALDNYWDHLNRVYGDTASPVDTAVLAVDADAPIQYLKDAKLGTLDEWIDTVLNNLPQE